MSSPPADLAYYRARELSVALGGERVRVVTKPGFPGWDGVTPASALLFEAICEAGLPDGGRALVLGCGHGALGAALAARSAGLALTLMDVNVAALAMARRTLKANGVSSASVSDAITLLPEGAGSFDLVAIELPQSRQLARRWLVEAHGLLRPGGRLFLAGPNDQGVQSVIADAGALFGGATLLRYKAHNRVARAERAAAEGPPPGWAREPGIAPGTWRELSVELAGRAVALASLPGVFSFDRLDEGTALLLAALPVRRGARVLDAGCGYGALGIHAALSGAARVDMVDISTLAVAAARENIARLGIEADALASDALSAVSDRRYDLIASNPPFHAGKQVDHEAAETFIAHGRRLLARGGRLVLVANRFIRYDRQLRELFGSVEILAETRRFHVLAAP